MRSCQSEAFVSPEVSSPELAGRESGATSETAPNGWHDPVAGDEQSEAGSAAQEAAEEAAAAGQSSKKGLKNKKKKKKVRASHDGSRS